MEFLEIQKEADKIVAEKWTAGISVQMGSLDRSYYISSGYMDELSDTRINPHTLYDLASVSKLYVLVAIMKLQEQKVIDIEKKISDYTPLFSNIGDLRLFELMNFTDGLTTSSRIDLCSNYDEALQVLYNIRKTNTQTQYSDMGIIVITQIIDSILGGPSSFKKYITKLWEQAGLTETFWWTDLPQSKSADTLCYDKEYRILNGQFYTSHAFVGQVHDKKAQILGFSGHAGVFSTASDIALFSEKLLHQEILNDATIALITSDKYNSFTQTQTYGLMCYKKNPDKKFSEIPENSSPKSIAMSGYTGVYLFLDFENKNYVFIGSNRINNRLTENDNSLPISSTKNPWLKYVKDYVYRKDILRDLCIEFLDPLN